MPLPPFGGIHVAGDGHGAQALVSMRHPVRPTTKLPLHRRHE